MNRRQFIASAGGLVTAVGLGPPASARQFSEQPDHVTLTGYDDAPDDIDQYRPMLDLSDLEVDPSRIYAWRATSPEYDADWYCYIAYYAAQYGVEDADSHYPDREPVYVAVDGGDVDRVLYSEYHYSVGVDDDPALYEGSHPKFGVQRRWHQHFTTEANGTLGVTRGDLTDVYPDWLTNGWRVNRSAVVDPASVESRETWWPDTRAAQTDHTLARAYGSINDRLPVDIGNPFRET